MSEQLPLVIAALQIFARYLQSLCGPNPDELKSNCYTAAG